MNKHLQTSIWRVSCAALTLALASVTLPSLAQVNDPINPGQFENNAEKDPYFGGSNGSDFNVLNLMRNAQLGTLRNSNELIDEQRQDWNKGADDFRRQQLERLGNSNTAPSPVTPPSGN